MSGEECSQSSYGEMSTDPDREWDLARVSAAAALAIKENNNGRKKMKEEMLEASVVEVKTKRKACCPDPDLDPWSFPF